VILGNARWDDEIRREFYSFFTSDAAASSDQSHERVEKPLRNFVMAVRPPLKRAWDAFRLTRFKATNTALTKLGTQFWHFVCAFVFV